VKVEGKGVIVSAQMRDMNRIEARAERTESGREHSLGHPVVLVQIVIHELRDGDVYQRVPIGVATGDANGNVLLLVQRGGDIEDGHPRWASTDRFGSAMNADEADDEDGALPVELTRPIAYQSRRRGPSLVREGCRPGGRKQKRYSWGERRRFRQ
jgi:hypothetical protein